MGDINITIDAVDRASSVLKGVSGAIVTLNQGLQLAGQVYRSVSQIINQTVGEYVKYSDQVRRVNQLTGQNSEASSRLIQVLDDYKISIDSINAANRTFITQGKTMSVETLASLSDEYNKLSDSTERNRFMIQNFGRDYQKFLLIMQAGGDAIRENSAAINQNLILNDKQVKAAREYEIALDGLNDSVTAVKVSIGNQLIPTLTKLATTTNQMISIQDNFSLANMRGLTFIEQMAAAFTYIQQPMGAFKLLVMELKELGPMIFQNLPIQIDTAKNSMDDLARSTLDAAGTFNDAEQSVSDFSKQLSSISSFAADWTASTKDIEAAQAELDAALAAGYAANGEYVNGLRDKVNELKEAQQRQTDSWVLGIMTEQLAMDGLSKREMDFLLQYQVDTGLITQDAADRAAAEYAYALALAGTAAKADEARRSILDIPERSDKYVDIWITTHQGGGGESGPGKVQQAARSAQANIFNTYAGGGSFAGWAMVGDAPGGGVTPYTEYVYAPHGAVVYNQRQMSGQSAPPMASGGIVPPTGGMTIDGFSPVAADQLAQALALKLQSIL